MKPKDKETVHDYLSRVRSALRPAGSVGGGHHHTKTISLCEPKAACNNELFVEHPSLQIRWTRPSNQTVFAHRPVRDGTSTQAWDIYEFPPNCETLEIPKGVGDCADTCMAELQNVLTLRRQNSGPEIDYTRECLPPRRAPRHKVPPPPPRMSTRSLASSLEEVFNRRNNQTGTPFYKCDYMRA